MLRDPRWQKMRLLIMHRDKFTCLGCGDDKTTLNVHHRHYRPGAAPWEYEPEDLITLCENCHHAEHFPSRKEIIITAEDKATAIAKLVVQLEAWKARQS